MLQFTIVIFLFIISVAYLLYRVKKNFTVNHNSACPGACGCSSRKTKNVQQKIKLSSEQFNTDSKA